MLAGLFAFMTGTGLEYLTAEDSYAHAYDIGYAIWLSCFLYWFVVSTIKGKKRDMTLDKDTLDFLFRFRETGNAKAEFFVECESNHTTVNWLRNLRNKKTIRLFTGAYQEDHEVESRTSYVLSDKDIFHMRLRGYVKNAPDAVVLEALEDEWLLKRRSNFQ